MSATAVGCLLGAFAFFPCRTTELRAGAADRPRAILCEQRAGDVCVPLDLGAMPGQHTAVHITEGDVLPLAPRRSPAAVEAGAAADERSTTGLDVSAPSEEDGRDGPTPGDEDLGPGDLLALDDHLPL